MIPEMSERAKTFINRLTPEEIKEHILKEFKLTPGEYKRFASLIKLTEETFGLFASKLKAMLQKQLLKKQNIDNDHENLVDLLVADRLEDSLQSDVLQFIMTKEGHLNVFAMSETADLADVCK